MEIKIDKEFKGLIPKINYEEFLMLEESIKKEGCRDPLITWNKIILDGHNRHKICLAHEIEFKTKEIQIESREKAILWIINNQLGRRNICNYDRIILEFKKECITQGKSVTENVTMTREIRKEIAKKINISEGLISKVKQIHDTLNSIQEEEAIKNIRNNKETIGSTYNKIIKKEKPEKTEKKKEDSFALAEWMHDQYEEISKKKAWKTQKKCRVKFKDLPKENQAVMIELAKRIIKRFNL